MTRGNQRDTDRERALARAKAHQSGNSTIKSAEANTEKLRQKQAVADARKEEERQAALAAASNCGGRPAAPKEMDESELARREAIRVRKEAAVAEFIRRQVRAAMLAGSQSVAGSRRGGRGVTGMGRVVNAAATAPVQTPRCAAPVCDTWPGRWRK
jgi:hypothetical protein